MIPNRNGHHPHSSEPKVIALAATQTRPALDLLWQTSLLVLAYSILQVLSH